MSKHYLPPRVRAVQLSCEELLVVSLFRLISHEGYSKSDNEDYDEDYWLGSSFSNEDYGEDELSR